MCRETTGGEIMMKFLLGMKGGKLQRQIFTKKCNNIKTYVKYNFYWSVNGPMICFKNCVNFWE